MTKEIIFAYHHIASNGKLGDTFYEINKNGELVHFGSYASSVFVTHIIGGVYEVDDAEGSIRYKKTFYPTKKHEDDSKIAEWKLKSQLAKDDFNSRKEIKKETQTELDFIISKYKEMTRFKNNFEKNIILTKFIKQIS